MKTGKMKIRLLAVLFVMLTAATAQAGEDKWIYTTLQKEINPKIEALELKVEKLSQENAQLRSDLTVLYERLKKLETFHK